MKRNKIGLSILLLGAAGFTASLTNGEVSYVPSDFLAQNTEFLVALKGNELTKSAKEIERVQNDFLAELNSLIGRDNYTVVDNLASINVLKIKTNKAYEDVISSIRNVSKVAENQTYRFGDFKRGLTEAEKKEGYVVYENTAQDATDAQTTDNSNTSAKTMNVPTENSGGAGSFVAILDSGFYMEHDYFANFDDANVKSIAEQRFSYEDLRSVSSKLTAKASKVLDNVTVDYQATDRADGSLYWNLKIPFYYDYGASSQNSSNDFDVLSPWSEHGTHVASITGANGTYDGIAPNAQLALMKVFYESIPTDSTGVGGVYATDDDILEALNDCVVLGIDSLNMSLGSDLDDFSDKSVSMTVIDSLQQAGVNCNIAAGNAGKTMFSSMGLYKNWSLDNVDTGVLGSYSNSSTANVIASSTNPTQYYEAGLTLTYPYTDPDTKETETRTRVIAYQDQVDYSDGSDGITEQNERIFAEILKDKDVELVAPVPSEGNNFYGTASDYARAPDGFYEGKVAIVDRGSNSFVDKANAAEDAGCAALIVVNNDPTAYEFNFGMSWSSGDANNTPDIPEIPVVFVLYGDRETLFSEYLTEVVTNESGQPVARTSAENSSSKIITETEADNPNAYEMSNFSSEGVTYDLTLNPTVSAPGSSIRGATLGEANKQGQVIDLDPTSVGYLSGTSMATPNYTGIVALMLGEKQAESMSTNGGRLLTNEERLTYLKTVAMRTMSTATQYEYTNQIYDELEIQHTTTDDDYHTPVDIYIPVNPENNTANYSPRKQGAGVVDASKAINSDVYLEGLVPHDDGTYGEEGQRVGNNSGKVELKNNDLIKNGDLSIGVRLHNEGKAAQSYKATIQIMTAAVSGYHNHDNELANYVAADAKYEGAKMQTVYDKVLEEVTLDQTITVPANGSVDAILNHTLTQTSKNYLEQYPNGMFVEGYVYFQPVGNDSEESRLSIPYLGFYKDYEQADATEPFDFEKEETYDIEEGKTDGTLYGSDVVNYLASNSYSKTFADMSSTIVGDSYSNYNRYNRRTSVQVNDNNPTRFGNALTYKKDENGNITLYVGSDTTDVLYVQEFVYRSMDSETVEIFDELGNAVVSKNVTDLLSNSIFLYKSHVSANYIADYSLAHRGFAEIPLYNEDGAKLADGNYKIRFTYNLVYGTSQVKEFDLVLDSQAPRLVSKVIITDESGNKTLRLKFNEIYIPSNDRISVNAGLIKNYTVTKVSDGYLVDIPLTDELFANGKALIRVSDANDNRTLILINENDVERGLFIESSALTAGTSYSYTVTEGSGNGRYNINDVYEVSATSTNGNAVNLGTYRVTISYNKKINSSVRVYEIGENDARTSITNFELLDDSTITFTTSSLKFAIQDQGRSNEDISQSDNATINIAAPENGTVYCDKVSGRAGDVAVIYAIPNSGYKVGSVTVNGVAIAMDTYGNYQFVLVQGANEVVVTFVEA